ncbi:MAG: 16S rRNA (cytidine(1402)-2'-O)-methyltransferase [Chloroflexota bacterium]|nr:MAG: 16S rRNA (cytidine(1402)-2'-O)-methyltransferase [Chloroflexota bacterium]
MPTLFLVGTPIGNLEDISLRALRVLREATLVAAEDTRVTGRLLRHYKIATPMVSYHEFSRQGRIDELIERAKAGDVALVSDAGMPGLSDPGYRLVKAAIEAGYQVSPIPGPSAAVAALVSSGLPTEKYLFLGFLPRQQSARRAALQSVAQLPYTLVIYEAPHRLLNLLADIVSTLGDRELCIARELTKLYEETWRGAASQAIRHFRQGQIRGEITVVITGAGRDEVKWAETEVLAELEKQLAEGASNKQAVSSLVEQSGWNRRDVYRLALQIRKDHSQE